MRFAESRFGIKTFQTKWIWHRRIATRRENMWRRVTILSRTGGQGYATIVHEFHTLSHHMLTHTYTHTDNHNCGIKNACILLFNFILFNFILLNAMYQQTDGRKGWPTDRHVLFLRCESKNKNENKTRRRQPNNALPKVSCLAIFPSLFYFGF